MVGSSRDEANGRRTVAENAEPGVVALPNVVERRNGSIVGAAMEAP
jgi:hypothetical protein